MIANSDGMEGKQINIQIRMAAPGDAPSIESVLYESFIEYKPSYTEEGFAATTPASEQIQNRIKEGPMWVALNDNLSWVQHQQFLKERRYTYEEWVFFQS